MRGHGYAARDRERYTRFARRATEPSVAALGLPDMQQAFSINAPQRRFSGFQFSRPPPCLPVRGAFEKINLREKRPSRSFT